MSEGFERMMEEMMGGRHPLLALLGEPGEGNPLAELMEKKLRDNPTDRVLQEIIDATKEDRIPWSNSGERGWQSFTAILDEQGVILRVFMEEDQQEFDEETGQRPVTTILEVELDEEVHQLHLNSKGVKVREFFHAVMQKADERSSRRIHDLLVPMFGKRERRGRGEDRRSSEEGFVDGFEQMPEELRKAMEELGVRVPKHRHDCANCCWGETCPLPEAAEWRKENGIKEPDKAHEDELNKEMGQAEGSPEPAPEAPKLHHTEPTPIPTSRIEETEAPKDQLTT